MTDRRKAVRQERFDSKCPQTPFDARAMVHLQGSDDIVKVEAIWTGHTLLHVLRVSTIPQCPLLQASSMFSWMTLNAWFSATERNGPALCGVHVSVHAREELRPTMQAPTVRKRRAMHRKRLGCASHQRLQVRRGRQAGLGVIGTIGARVLGAQCGA